MGFIVNFNISDYDKITKRKSDRQPDTGVPWCQFAPEFAHLNDDILFGEVWSRNDLLSLRDRSIVTVCCSHVTGVDRLPSFKYHLESAKRERGDQN